MRVLSGMQPSGEMHLGNYFGSVKPNIDLLGSDQNIYIIVDLHALTSVHNPDELRSYRQSLILDLLACGFDPERGILFFQSYVPEHTELAWILSCLAPMGLMERAVSYKDKVSKGIDASLGLFAYPILQAADILLYDTDIVPVGKDQKQHLEIARDVAEKMNAHYGKGTVVVPDIRIREDVAVVPGTDGQKMSKSYKNVIPVFVDEKVIKQAIMGIVTDSKEVEEKKDPEQCIVYQIHSLLLDDQRKNELADRYRAGGLGYGQAKELLFRDFMEYFHAARARRTELEVSFAEQVIIDGAAKAQNIAWRTMERVRARVGLR